VVPDEDALGDAVGAHRSHPYGADEASAVADPYATRVATAVAGPYPTLVATARAEADAQMSLAREQPPITTDSGTNLGAAYRRDQESSSRGVTRIASWHEATFATCADAK
jgi:hypothetical protein